MSYGQATPYFPVIDLLKRYAQVDEHDDTRTIRAKVTGHVLTLDETLHATLSALLSLVEALPGDSPFLHLDPSQRRQHTLDALKCLVLRESQVQPLLLVFEDLHWIDTETQTLLDSLVESLPTSQLLLLVNYRPEYQHGWGSKTYYTQLRLDTLPAAQAEEFLDALLGDAPSLAPLKQLLIARTEGNPFFLEESVRTLVETGVLVGEPGAYRLVQALPTIQVPATVLAVLAARIDRLPPEEKHLLQSAAVIGTAVPLPLLQAIADVPEAVLHRGLAHLQAAEFLYETRLFPTPDYTFKHALTHEVAYNSLLLERRRGLHARWSRPSRRWRPSGELSRSNTWRTMPCGVWCGTRRSSTVSRPAPEPTTALHSVRRWATTSRPSRPSPPARVRRHAGGGPRTPPRVGRRAHHPGRVRAAPRPVGRGRGSGAGAQRSGPAGTGTRLHGEFTQDQGDLDSALAVGQQAFALAAALGESTVQVQAAYDLALVYYALGDFGQAAELWRRTMEAADRVSGTPSTDLRIRAQTWLARTLGQLGAFAEGRHHGEAALRLATREGRGDTPIAAHRSLGLLYLAQGDLEHARRVLESGLALCRASGHRNVLPVIAAGLGYAVALQGRLAEGRALVEEAIRESLSTGALGQHAGRVAWLSEVCRLAGRREEAWQHAHQALDLARQLKARGDEAHALHQLAVVSGHAASPDAAHAEALYQQALALAKELGMRPLQAHSHRGLGLLYATTGQPEQARTALTTAITLYRAMDMAFWLPETEAALAQVDA